MFRKQLVHDPVVGYRRDMVEIDPIGIPCFMKSPGQSKAARNVNKKIVKCVHTLYTYTPYSMNRLFVELFRKFGGWVLEVFETI